MKNTSDIIIQLNDEYVEYFLERLKKSEKKKKKNETESRFRNLEKNILKINKSRRWKKTVKK